MAAKHLPTMPTTCASNPGYWLVGERRLLVELGSRDHVIVRYDETFRLLTAPHSGNKPTRVVDRQRGVFVDGMHYWHECLAKAKPSVSTTILTEYKVCI